jgi:hypothetical protein
MRLISSTQGFVLVFAAMVSLAPIGCGHETAAPSGDAVISDKGITIDGKLIPVPCTEKEIVAVLGEPSRKLAKANTILVWDDRGIIAYFTPGTDKGHAVDIVLNPETFDFSPKTTFTHQVSVDGKAIGKSSGKADVLAAGYTAVAPLPFLFEHSVGTLISHATTDPAGKELQDINLEIPVQ